MDDRGFAVSSDRVFVKRRGLTRRLAWAALLASSAGITAVFLEPSMLGPTLLLWFIGWLVAATSLVNMRFSPTVSPSRAKGWPGEVRIEDGILGVRRGEARRTYPLGDVIEGWLEAYDTDSTVLLRMRGGDLVSIGVDAPPEGDRLLDAVGAGAGQRVVKMRLAGRSASSVTVGWIVLVSAVVCTIALMIAGGLVAVRIVDIFRYGLFLGWGEGLLGPALVAAASLVGFYFMIWATTPPLAVIGTDGIAIHHLLRRTFIPFTQVAHVRAHDKGVLLELHQGKERLLATRSSAADSRKETWASTLALLYRIREAMVAANLGSAKLVRATVLDREGRSLSAWRAHLERLAAGTADYRSLSLSPVEIAQVLEDAGAPAERRIAAAFALAKAAEPALGRRVRAAVESCADERLRIALDEAAAGEIEEEQVERVRRRRVEG